MAKKNLGPAKVTPGEAGTSIATPSLQGRRLPQMIFHGDPQEDSDIQSWGEDLRDAWKDKFKTHLTNNALSYIAMYGPCNRIRPFAGAVLDLMGGQDCKRYINGDQEFKPGESWEEQQLRRMRGVSESNSKSEVLVKTETTTVTEGEQGGKRYYLFEYNVTSVIRWMGKDGFTKEQIEAALKAFNLEVNPVTITAQRSAGQKGQRGDPAPLTPAQQEQLRKAGGK